MTKDAKTGQHLEGLASDPADLPGSPSGSGHAAVDIEWPLFEVFLRSKRGLNHVHVGSLHAADAQMALYHARDLYTRRNEAVAVSQEVTVDYDS